MSPEQARGEPEPHARNRTSISSGPGSHTRLADRAARVSARLARPEIMTAIIREEADAPAGRRCPRRCAGSSSGCWRRTRRSATTRRAICSASCGRLRDRLGESSSVSRRFRRPAPKPIPPPARAKPRRRRWRLAAAGARAGRPLQRSAGPVMARRAGVGQLPSSPRWRLPGRTPSGCRLVSGWQGTSPTAPARPSHRRLFVRYLDSPTATASDSEARRLVRSRLVAGQQTRDRHAERTRKGRLRAYALYSASVVGGEPDLLMPIESAFPRISPDGTALAAVTFDKANLWF